jgi:hypothetical protein
MNLWACNNPNLMELSAQPEAGVMQEKRKRGRPTGAKNKKINLSGASVERICEFHKYNPVEHLIRIATGVDSEEWSQDNRARAVHKLVDSIHNKRAIVGAAFADDALDGQFEIVFHEDGTDFQLPRQTNAARITEVLREQPI